jgi:hypothetical protein
MMQHLHAQSNALCNNQYYIFQSDDFKINTAGGYLVARVPLGKQYISFKFHEQKYLSCIFFIVHNQLTGYTETLPDVLNHITSALYSNTQVKPSPTANKAILYYQLFK